MIRNNPYSEEAGPLVGLVTTPIGNLKDITYRAVEFLQKADIIACEDTRTTGLLLKHYGIKPRKLVSLYAQTEANTAKTLIKDLQETKGILAYCSDAGMPGISDPGALLVKACYDANVRVTILPGPNAALSALVISGIDSADFSFYGFLPTKSSAITAMLSSLKDREESLIFYESPKRVMKTLALMKNVFGPNREVSLIRELTKIHEEVIHGTLSEMASLPQEIKGECVIIVKGATLNETIDEDAIRKELKAGLKMGMPLSSLSKEIALAHKIGKNAVYRIGLTLTK
jgi:16S rRNA (cytidine1402-2'-O)-methyltransferase